MRARVTLRSPFGGTVVRDIVEGRWAEASGEADQILGDDHWALPGLVDAHAHLAAEDLAQPGDLEAAQIRARSALGAGVMLILDKGWCDLTTIRVIEQIPPGERPDIEAAGRIITVPGGYFPDFGREIDPEDIVEAVAGGAREGAGWVKLIGDWPRKGRGPVANFSESQLRSAVETAHRAGCRVAIHTMAPEIPGAAVAAGIDSIEHGLFLGEDDLADLGARQGQWVPTVSRVETTIVQLGEGSSGGRLLADGLARMRRLLPLALEAGVVLLAGTDLVGAPADVSREVVKLAEYGLSNRQALMSAIGSTLPGAGSHQFPVGAPANAVLYPDDPLNDLAVLRWPKTVIRIGEVR